MLLDPLHSDYGVEDWYQSVRDVPVAKAGLIHLPIEMMYARV